MARKQTYGVDHTREGYEYRGVGRKARIESPEDREKKLRDLPWKKGMAIGGAAGAIAGAASSQPHTAIPAERARESAQARLNVRRRNYDRHIRKGPGNTTKTPIGTIRDKQAARVLASGKKLTTAKEAYKKAADNSPIGKRPLIRSIGKGAAIGSGLGLLASLLMEEQSDNEYALEEIFELSTRKKRPRNKKKEREALRKLKESFYNDPLDEQIELGLGRDITAYMVKKTKNPYRKVFRDPARKVKAGATRKVREVKAARYLKKKRAKRPAFDGSKYPPGKPIGSPAQAPEPPKSGTDWKKVGLGAGLGVTAGAGGVYAYKSHKEKSA